MGILGMLLQQVAGISRATGCAEALPRRSTGGSRFGDAGWNGRRGLRDRSAGRRLRGPGVGAPGALVCDRPNGPKRLACSYALSSSKHAPHLVRAEGVGRLLGTIQPVADRRSLGGASAMRAGMGGGR